MHLADLTVLGLYLTVLTLFSVYGLHRWHLLWLARRHRRPGSPTPALSHPVGRQPGQAAEPASLPRVTVQLPIYNEPRVVERLLQAVCRLDYPLSRLEIQVLDDSNDETTGIVAHLAARARQRGLDIQHLHRAERSGFKAGALAAGLRLARGEFICIFDADFLPPPGFIRALLPAFADRSCGMVQARWGHVNRKRFLLTRIQAVFLDGHFLVEQLARHRSGRFFNFNGTAGIWRRACIEDAGGWQADTLTEDLDLSYRAQLAGWRFVFEPDVVAPAEVPAAMAAFKSQQHRWAKGSIQTARKLLGTILRSRHPWRIRLEVLFHLTENCAYILMVALAVLLWPTIRARQRFDAAAWMYADLAILAAAWLSVAVFYVFAQRRAGRGTLESALAVPGVMIIGAGLALNNSRAALEALAGKVSPFVRTAKDGWMDGGPEDPERLSPPWHRIPLVSWWRWLVHLPGLEIGFALYLLVALVDIASRGLWHWTPFLALFLAGFAHAGGRGIAESWRTPS